MNKQEKRGGQGQIYSVVEWLAAKKNNPFRPEGVM
jgi:hypothetical protein